MSEREIADLERQANTLSDPKDRDALLAAIAELRQHRVEFEQAVDAVAHGKLPAGLELPVEDESLARAFSRRVL